MDLCRATHDWGRAHAILHRAPGTAALARSAPRCGHRHGHSLAQPVSGTDPCTSLGLCCTRVTRTVRDPQGARRSCGSLCL